MVDISECRSPFQVAYHTSIRSIEMMASKLNGATGGDEYWWATLDILAGREEKKPRKDIVADIEEWLNKVTAKIAKQRKIALETPKVPETVNNTKLNVETSKQDGAKSGKIKIQVPVQECQYIQTSFGDHIEIEFDFNNPRIRSRLEKLMGSNVVRITDRKYMIKLQERIKEDHLENQKKRIQEREAEEVEREKKLILEGKIPMDAAPKELKNHPVCKINQITKKILEDKKGKAKAVVKTPVVKPAGKKVREPGEQSERDEMKESSNGDQEVSDKSPTDEPDDPVKVEPTEEVNIVVLKKDEYDKLKYEAPLVKMLKQVENVDEMYKLAEEIVGPLKHQKTSK